MCVTAVVAVAGLALGAYQADQQVKAGNEAAGEKRRQGHSLLYEGVLDQEMRNLEARDISQAAQKEADDIKRQAMLIRGQMAVAQSGSGVTMGEGSAQAAVDQLDTLSSADALAALFSGVNRSVSTRANGNFAYQQGQQGFEAANRSAVSIQKSAKAQATGTLISSGIKAGGALYGSSTFGGGSTGNPMARYTSGNLGSGD